MGVDILSKATEHFKKKYNTDAIYVDKWNPAEGQMKDFYRISAYLFKPDEHVFVYREDFNTAYGFFERLVMLYGYEFNTVMQTQQTFEGEEYTITWTPQSVEYIYNANNGQYLVEGKKNHLPGLSKLNVSIIKEDDRSENSLIYEDIIKLKKDNSPMLSYYEAIHSTGSIMYCRVAEEVDSINEFSIQFGFDDTEPIKLHSSVFFGYFMKLSQEMQKRFLVVVHLQNNNFSLVDELMCMKTKSFDFSTAY